jgi:hypothetical protein
MAGKISKTALLSLLHKQPPKDGLAFFTLRKALLLETLLGKWLR